MNGQNANLAWLQQQFPELVGIQGLSAGGQKEVFSADHAQDGPVVLKLIHPRQDIETTRRELLAVNQLASAQVPKIFDTGTIPTQLGQCFWFREQRIIGQTLRECLRAGPLPAREVLKLGREVLKTLVQAEGLNIVHRDVKPDNIIRDASGGFWLIDFGLARHLDLQSITASVHPFGKFTVGYAPPEQYRNLKDDIDSRCDLFAVGVTMYEAGVGQNPFTHGARDAVEVFRRVETQPLPPLLLRFGGQTELMNLVAAMTQRRRDHRPSSVAETFDWMDQICTAEGI